MAELHLQRLPGRPGLRPADHDDRRLVQHLDREAAQSAGAGRVRDAHDEVFGSRAVAGRPADAALRRDAGAGRGLLQRVSEGVAVDVAGLQVDRQRAAFGHLTVGRLRHGGRVIDRRDVEGQGVGHRVQVAATVGRSAVVAQLEAEAGMPGAMGVLGRGEDQLAGVDGRAADELPPRHCGAVELQAAGTLKVREHDARERIAVDVGEAEVRGRQHARRVFQDRERGVRSRRRGVGGGGDEAHVVEDDDAVGAAQAQQVEAQQRLAALQALGQLHEVGAAAIFIDLLAHAGGEALGAVGLQVQERVAAAERHTSCRAQQGGAGARVEKRHLEGVARARAVAHQAAGRQRESERSVGGAEREGLGQLGVPIAALAQPRLPAAQHHRTAGVPAGGAVEAAVDEAGLQRQAMLERRRLRRR